MGVPVSTQSVSAHVPVSRDMNKNAADTSREKEKYCKARVGYNMKYILGSLQLINKTHLLLLGALNHS